MRQKSRDTNNSPHREELSDTQRKSYIDATLCLINTPAKNGITGAQNLWDELHFVHIVQSAYIHFVGAFLPFHRYFLLAHETLLKKECGYKGPIPYVYPLPPPKTNPNPPI